MVGLARYSTIEPVRLFVDSFIANRRSAELYLLVERSRIAVWRPLESSSVHLVPIRRLWPLETETRMQYRFRRLLDIVRLLDLVPPLDRLLLATGRRPLAPLFEQPHVARLWYELRLVRRELANAPWIFLTDVRDVVFQGAFESAFDEAVAQAPLHVYEEPIGLGHDDDLAGLPQVAVLDPSFAASGPVLCVGTVLGRPRALAVFLERMLRALTVRPGRYPRTLDQGALNLLYYAGGLADLQPVAEAPGSGGVLTAGFVTDASVDADGIHWGGSFPAVVHQYDRLSGAREAYEARFSRRK